MLAGEPDRAMVPTGDAADYPAALEAVRAAMTPADPEALARAYAECAARCAPVRESGEGAEAAALVAVRTLTQYPADVALAVLGSWRGTWAPRANEIEARCEALVQPRRDLMASLEWSARQPVEAFKIPDRTPEPERGGWHEAPTYPQPRPPHRSAADQSARLRSLSETGA